MQLVGRVHQEFHHALLTHLFRAPGPVKPRLGQVRRVVGTVTQQGMATHTVLGLSGQLALGDHGLGLFFGQFLAEQGFLSADHRYLNIACLIKHIINSMIDHGIGGDTFPARRDLLHRIEGEKNEYYERACRNPDGHLSPKGFGCPP